MKAFLVRLWTAEGVGEPRRVLRGVVEPVGEGDVTPFRNERELLDLLYEGLALEGPTEAGRTGGAGVT